MVEVHGDAVSSSDSDDCSGSARSADGRPHRYAAGIRPTIRVGDEELQLVDTDSRGGSLTGQAVVTPTGELLTAVAHLSDEELLLLSKLAWRLANDFTEESTRPRVAEVIHRCGVVLAEEHDRRRALVEHARQQVNPDGRLSCLLRDGDDPDLENPSTD